MNDLSIGNEQMMEVFLFETTSLLDELDEILFRSEKKRELTAEEINAVFRIIHTIKGSSAMMEFHIISSVSHRLEDALYLVREKGVDAAHFESLLDLMLDTTEFLKSQLEAIQSGSALADSNNELVERADALKILLGSCHQSAQAESEAPSPSPQPSVEETVSDGCSAVPPPTGNEYRVTVHFEADCGMENLRALMFLNSLENSYVVGRYLPAELESDPNATSIIAKSGFVVELTSSLGPEEVARDLKDFLHVDRVAVAEPGELLPSSPPPGAASPSEAGREAQAISPVKQNLINVNLNKLDQLMDLMGELVIAESMVDASEAAKSSKQDAFQKASRQLHKLTNEMQQLIMSMRMIPVAGTFHKMRRVVRDMSRNLKKDVDLALVGEDTDIDKTIIDNIADPIMHLVRNAMDHGVESPQERQAKGKSAKGTITLSARNTGGEVLISVSDDGRGLNPARVLEKAKQLGLLEKAEEEYTDKEVCQFLLLPGFSTKESVTEYSGRGVGMDVVCKNIDRIGGTLYIENTPGQGMAVFMKIPLTLAIVDGMEFLVGGSIYTLQIASIVECFKAGEDQIVLDTSGNEMIMIRGKVYPVIRLNRFYGIEGAVEDIAQGIFIWVHSGEQSACLFVDELIGEHQIVVKPLPTYFKRFQVKSHGISSCTILGDGNISLILDVGSIIQKVVGKR